MNIANKLTSFRVLLIPVFLFFYYYPILSGDARILAAAVFVLASFTDLIDGAVARRYKLITRFGMFLDPLADKLLVCAALVVMCANGPIHPLVSVAIVSREFIVTGIRLVAAEQGAVIAADIFGKYKTAFQMVTIIYYLFGLQVHGPYFDGAGRALVIVTLILTVFSAFNYIYKNKSIFKGGI